MKRLSSLILLFLGGVFVLTSCHFSYSNRSSQPGHIVKSSGTTVRKTIEVAHFTGIEASTGIHVILTDGAKNKVTVETDENFYNQLDITVSGGVLNISVKGSIQLTAPRDAIYVYVSGKDISSISLSSAATVTSDIKLAADKLKIEMSSASKFSGDVECKTIRAELSSSAYMDIRGKADVFQIDVSSAASVNAEKLIAGKVVCDLSSASKANLYAADELYIDASSGGKVVYEGQPRIVHIDTSSGASVSKK